MTVPIAGELWCWDGVGAGPVLIVGTPTYNKQDGGYLLKVMSLREQNSGDIETRFYSRYNEKLWRKLA